MFSFFHVVSCHVMPCHVMSFRSFIHACMHYSFNVIHSSVRSLFVISFFLRMLASCDFIWFHAHRHADIHMHFSFQPFHSFHLFHAFHSCHVFHPFHQFHFMSCHVISLFLDFHSRIHVAFSQWYERLSIGVFLPVVLFMKLPLCIVQVLLLLQKYYVTIVTILNSRELLVWSWSMHMCRCLKCISMQIDMGSCLLWLA